MPRKFHKNTKKIIKKMGATESLDSGRIFQDNDAKKKISKFTSYGYNGVSIEVKVTGKKSYILKKETWNNVKTEAGTDNLLPILVIELDEYKLAVLELDDFLVMCKDLQKSSNDVK